MHSDQERLLESELYRFVRFQYEIVAALARALEDGGPERAALQQSEG